MVYSDQEIIAVGVVLLLPEEVQERVCQLNSLLHAERPDGFLFGPSTVPHLSLAQLFVRRSSLLALIERLDKTLRETEPLPLSVAKISGRGAVASLRIARTPELFRLHAQMMDEVKSLSEDLGGMESFFSDGEPARSQDAEWVTRFRGRASYKRFVPHITLGNGHPPVPDVILKFTTAEAGLFHLGRFCTCRKLLHRWKLH